jgi:ATP-dependent exoDNAse (exonuclease V) alpha subunit
LDHVIPKDDNKTGGLPKELSIFPGARVMLRYNINTAKGLVNGAMRTITEIIWPFFRRAQLYDQDIPAVKIDFGETGVHQIDAMTAQFPAKYSCGTAERRMLPLILCWGCTVHKMQGTTVCTAVVNLGSKLFAPGQAYVALSRVKSLNGLLLDELDCGKLTNENTANTDAIKEMERLRTLAKFNAN